MFHRAQGLVVVAVLAAALTARAEDAARKPVGTWEHTAGDGKVTLHVAADHLVLTVAGGGGSFKVVVHADYGVTKDGTLFGICTKAEKEGTDDGPKVGDLFSFKVAVDKEKLTLSELKPGSDEAKAILQGEYKLVPEKK